MKAKLLAMGAAAGLIVATTTGGEAQVVPEPGDFDYANMCSAFGEGYFQVPGSNTCMKVSAGVRTDYNAYVDDFDGSGGGVRSGMRNRGTASASTVTDTEFGPLRTHVGVSVKNNGASDPFRPR